MIAALMTTRNTHCWHDNGYATVLFGHANMLCDFEAAALAPACFAVKAKADTDLKQPQLDKLPQQISPGIGLLVSSQATQLLKKLDKIVPALSL